MKKRSEPAPTFKSEDAERAFWATHSPLDYGYTASDVAGGSGPFPNLKPSLKSISIRIPADMLAELKALANKIDVPYQSLAKVYLARQIALRGARRSNRGGIGPTAGCTPQTRGRTPLHSVLMFWSGPP